MATAEPIREAGVIYFGKYELLSRINIGGMAEIVKARESTPFGERVLAIKRILPHLCADELYRTMFMDESRVLAQLDHPSIIHAYEIGEITGTPFIALEYVHGQDVRELFHACQRTEQILPVALSCYIIARICEGLQHAHDQTDADGESLGIVHRDVSLQNILVGYDGEVKLTDFGIAVSAENQSRTEAGVVKGKFGYMSPEQIKGSPLDRRSDVFASGICLYELLTGDRLFSGDSDYKAVERVRNVDIDPPSAKNRQIPSSLERIVMKALAKHPRDRYQSSNDLRRALQSYLAESNQFVERSDLGAFMLQLFADEFAASEQEEAARRERSVHTSVTAVQPTPDPGAMFDDAEQTMVASSGRHLLPDAPPPDANRDPEGGWSSETSSGLSAFDDLPPVRTISVEAIGDPAPAPSSRSTGRLVPSLIPDAASIPPSAAAYESAQPGGMPIGPGQFDMDWDEEEPTTVTQGFEDRAGSEPQAAFQEAAPADRPAHQAPHAQHADNVFHPPAAPALRPSARQPSIPTLEIPHYRSQFRGPLAFAAVFALGALLLTFILTRSHGKGTLRLETEPSDVSVLVNGKRFPGRSSPFVIRNLPSGVKHTLVVEKPGYTSWSTTLRVPADKVFPLPLVHLDALVRAQEPQPPAPQPTAAAPEPAPPPPVAEPSSPKPKRSATRPSSTGSTRAQSPSGSAGATPRTSSSSNWRASSTPSSAPAPRAAVSGGGTLRINSRPWSEVSVDGARLGNTPQMNIKLRAGTHTVTLSNPEFGVKKTLTIQIKDGETITRVVQLTP